MQRSGNRLVRPGLELFGISLLLLFLELACIRWFPSHVLFLTFFTNIVLLACFLGMSIGCLVAGRRTNFITWTPVFLLLALVAAYVVQSEQERIFFQVADDRQGPGQEIFFGTERTQGDLAKFPIPLEWIGGVFFLLIALALVGPGQELGRALERVPNRVASYTLNILGSIAGIVLFAGCSLAQLPPFWWFFPVLLGIGYLVCRRLSGGRLLIAAHAAALAVALFLASWTSGAYHKGHDLPTPRTVWDMLAGSFTEPANGEHFWSPYYRVDFEHPDGIVVNLIGHQSMVSRDDPYAAYALPHLLNRDAGRGPFEDILIIGAGSGNDVSRALQWGAAHVDAVEIDPVIYRLGRDHHPDRPYQDPRVTVHLDDGRNFLRTTRRKYDLVIYALVDSLVLHSSYSNIRLESYLFTAEAFGDVRAVLKPDGAFVAYNYFRQGWLVVRLHQELELAFGAAPFVLTLPYRRTMTADENADGFTMFFSGAGTGPLREAFRRRPAYWLRASEAPRPDSANGFMERPGPGDEESWHRFGATTVELPAQPLEAATDDWPFFYLRQRMIPGTSLRGGAVMGGLALALLLAFLVRPGKLTGQFAFDVRMFFLGAGFMLIETRAVVHMALLFGSTWMVNSVVFFAVLLMILAANLCVLWARPARLWPFYVGLFLSLVAGGLVPADVLVGTSYPLRVAGACLLEFLPVAFAGVVFAVSFRQSTRPDQAFGWNVAGAMLGGLVEYGSMLLGFRSLIWVALVFYALSALRPAAVAAPEKA